jgi:hypothetical protein
LAEKLATLKNPPDDNNYTNWVKKCWTFYKNIQIYKHNQSNKTRFNHLNTLQIKLPQAQLPQAQLPPAGDLMQLDQATLSRMSLEDCKYCQTNNLCFYCKEQGHGIDTCEKKVMTDARNAGCGSHSSLSGYHSRANPRSLHYGCGCGQVVPVQNLYPPWAQYPAQYSA